MSNVSAEELMTREITRTRRIGLFVWAVSLACVPAGAGLILASQMSEEPNIFPLLMLVTLLPPVLFLLILLAGMQHRIKQVGLWMYVLQQDSGWSLVAPTLRSPLEPMQLYGTLDGARFALTVMTSLPIKMGHGLEHRHFAPPWEAQVWLEAVGPRIGVGAPDVRELHHKVLGVMPVIPTGDAGFDRTVSLGLDPEYADRATRPAVRQAIQQVFPLPVNGILFTDGRHVRWSGTLHGMEPEQMRLLLRAMQALGRAMA